MSSLDAMASSLTRLYELFIKIGYIKRENVKFPPHSLAQLDTEVCRNHGMSDLAIAFLIKIPWAQADTWEPRPPDLIPDSGILDFSLESDIKASRHPDHQTFAEVGASHYLDSGWLALTFWGGGSYGCALIVDVASGEMLPHY